MGSSWNNPYSPSDPKYREYEMMHDRNEQISKQTELMNQSLLEQRNALMGQQQSIEEMQKGYPMYTAEDIDSLHTDPESTFWANVILSPLYLGLFFLAIWLLYQIFSCITF